jgi:hypothetical protein
LWSGTWNHSRDEAVPRVSEPWPSDPTAAGGESRADHVVMDLRPTNPEHRTLNGLGDPGARIVVDHDRVEWEVYDESQWDFRMALDWDALPQTENPGLIFSSRVDRRRVWPAPLDWQRMTDEQLLALCVNARSMF